MLSRTSRFGARVKWQTFQIANLRNTGASDEQIKELFDEFWVGGNQNIGPRHVSAEFAVEATCTDMIP
jgi:hypothetical protein